MDDYKNGHKIEQALVQLRGLPPAHGGLLDDGLGVCRNVGPAEQGEECKRLLEGRKQGLGIGSAPTSSSQ